MFSTPPTSRRLASLIIFVLLLIAAPAHAKDWFVKAGSTGDGSKANPFGDPFEALDKCEANDAIHITEGRYTGKLQSGQWTIPYAGIQLLGGYKSDFSERDPWKFRTLLVWDKDSKNRPKDSRIVGKEGKVVLDGLILDCQDQNEYDPQDHGRTPKSLDMGESTVHLWLPSTVKNCIFINSGREGLVCPNGSTVENNLFFNTYGSALTINGLPPASDDAKTPAIVKNNMFVWSWDDRAAAKGGVLGSGIYMTGPANISNNIFAFCDNCAIYSTIATDRTSISNNVFFMNLWANFHFQKDGNVGVADDKTMDLLEEAGLKAFEGNTVVNPGLALDPAWMEGTAKRTAAEHGKLEMDDWNKLRQSLGMDLQGGPGKPATGLAPAYPVEKAIALLTLKNGAVKAGARMIKLDAKFSDNVAVAPAKNYQKTDILTWAKSPDTVDGKPLEMIVAVSSVTNIGGIPAAFKPEDHEGIRLHDANGEVWVTGFYKKGSAVNRTVTDAAGRYNGSGKADRLYVVQGTAYVLNGFPKAGFAIDTMVPFEITALAHTRAKGRDWFVKAGATGGDGSRDKPYRDPYQALEKSEAGDTLHVAGGDYVGKLRAGKWVIDCPDITMLGGYSADFSARDPFKNPTLLYCPEDYKSGRTGYILQGDGDHTGFVLDGFVFDKKLDNKYDATGDLLDSESDKSPMIWLSKPGCVVRNCVFINGAEGAARLGTAQTIENCIFFNNARWVVRIERAFNPEIPTVIRNNTFAFAWERRFGQGNGLTGDLLILEADVRAVVNNNIFEFADQQALRLNSNPKDVELTNNVFAHNLFAEVYRATDSLFIDNKNFADLRQLGFKKLEGNVLEIPGLPIDQKWFDVYLKRTASVPGKVQMDDWNKLREVMGQPMIATGGSAGTGFAPAYDRKLAMQLFPKDNIKAGAHPVKLDVKFEGVTKTAPTFEYADTTWDVARNANEWAKLDGKRVSLKVAIKEGTNQWSLDDITKDKYNAWQVGGPQGGNSPGLPMRVYTPVGTRIDRAFRQAKGYSNGAVEETHIIKGIARANRQMVIEAVERAD